MESYDHQKIEKKWQKEWEKKKQDRASDTSPKKKWYSLIEFPYPSGDGLHVGHIRSNTAMDVISRKRRMEGYNVLYPIGWDAFGLPTENYAIKTGIQPSVVTKKNTDTFRRQLKALGFSFDWSREVNTTDPKYYKWTQWIFLQFLKKGLAYKKKMAINWCPKDKIGLANEEVVDGKCERCGASVEKREKEQWMLAITKYADRLDKDLDSVDFLEKIKIQQRNWIGRSEGAEIEFRITNHESRIKVFTTRADTLFGVTYLVLAPEHQLLLDNNFQLSISNFQEVQNYISESKKKAEIERTTEGKEKTGVELEGIKAINPANNEEVPVWIADYVLADYGTGAVMAVPAHDKRDFEFAKKHNLPIKMVICPHYPALTCPVLDEAYVGEGHLVDSGEFNGMKSSEVKKDITEFVGGKSITTYKLRDWVFSRQRYWGEPIPVVHCEKCGIVPVTEQDLPVKLPTVKNYKPTETGESPLAAISKWVNTKCPKCKGKAKRETDTMPNWAGSSWYYLRYADPKNKKEFADKKKLKHWIPVDWYNGGMEHTTLHLLYSRFWHKFLYDLGLVPTIEPYQKRTSHGLILGEGGEKMSKSIGNVVNPDEIIKTVGADSLRLYEMFLGPFDQQIAWDTKNIAGSRRFVERIWRLQSRITDHELRIMKEKVGNKSSGLNAKRSTLNVLLNNTVKKVSEDIEAMKFNTAVSSLMILVNELEKEETVGKESYDTLLKLVAPFTPHVAEELWALSGNKKSIHLEKWPQFDAKLTKGGSYTIVVQVNGKVRASFEITGEISEAEAKERALGLAEIKKWFGESQIKKVIYVKNKLLNVVV